MERAVPSRLGVALPEPVSFLILYVLLAAGYPAVHDTLHNFRHALAIVPCH